MSVNVFFNVCCIRCRLLPDDDEFASCSGLVPWSAWSGTISANSDTSHVDAVNSGWWWTGPWGCAMLWSIFQAAFVEPRSSCVVRPSTQRHVIRHVENGSESSWRWSSPSTTVRHLLLCCSAFDYVPYSSSSWSTTLVLRHRWVSNALAGGVPASRHHVVHHLCWSDRSWTVGVDWPEAAVYRQRSRGRFGCWQRDGFKTYRSGGIHCDSVGSHGNDSWTFFSGHDLDTLLSFWLSFITVCLLYYSCTEETDLGQHCWPYQMTFILVVNDLIACFVRNSVGSDILLRY